MSAPRRDDCRPTPCYSRPPDGRLFSVPGWWRRRSDFRRSPDGGNSRGEGAAKRCTSGTRLGRSSRSAKRLIRCPRATASPLSIFLCLMGIAYRQRVLKNGLHVGPRLCARNGSRDPTPSRATICRRTNAVPLCELDSASVSRGQRPRAGQHDLHPWHGLGGDHAAQREDAAHRETDAESNSHRGTAMHLYVGDDSGITLAWDHATHPRTTFATDVQAILQHALAVRDAHQAGEVSAHGLAVARGHLINRLAERLDRPSRVPDVQRLAAHLTREFPPSGPSCLIRPSMPPTGALNKRSVRRS